MKDNRKTLVVIALFTLVFISIGWIAPVLYASYAPQERFIEVNQFEPQNTTVDAETHTVCWDRNVHRPSKADVTMELLIVDENGDAKEVSTDQFKTYFEEDENIDSFEQQLPDGELTPGKYRYVGVVEMQLSDGRVTRTFSWESDWFYVKNETVQNESC